MPLKKLLQLVLLLLAFEAIGNAQMRETALQGQVVDASGAPIPAVRILLINLDTLEEQRLVVKTNGKFAFPQITPGDYEVIAAAPSDSPCFRSAVERVRLEVDTTRTVHLVMMANPGACGADR